MKTKKLILNALLIAVAASSCTMAGYLPKSNEHVGSSQYGAHIEIMTVNRAFYQGELIAANQDDLVIRLHKKNKTHTTIRVYTIPYGVISDFTLRYAEGKNLGWTIPIFLVWSITHGAGLFLTTPTNMIASIRIAKSAKNEFEYRKVDINLQDLKMFARFPQGIPDHIRLEDIK